MSYNAVSRAPSSSCDVTTADTDTDIESEEASSTATASSHNDEDVTREIIVVYYIGSRCVVVSTVNSVRENSGYCKIRSTIIMRVSI